MTSTVNYEKPRTLVGKIVTEIIDKINCGVHSEGKLLPSIRLLAIINKVSKSTAVDAYDCLVANGYVEAKPGVGFFVARRSPSTFSSENIEDNLDPLWIFHNRNILSNSLNLGYGWMPKEYLPSDVVKFAMRSVSRSQVDDLLGYGELKGLPLLRENIANKLHTLSINVDIKQVLLTDSAGHALDIILRELLKPGDIIFVDEPTSFNFNALAQLYDVQVIGVPMLKNGWNPSCYEELVKLYNPKVYLCNSVFHNPTGITIDPRDAFQILKISQAHNVTIIEDDVYGDLDEGNATRMATLDGLNQVIYISSFSKTISGACRCGYIVGNIALIERCTRMKAKSACGNSSISSQIVNSVLLSGGYRRWVRSTIRQLSEDRHHVIDMLGEVGFEIPHIPIGGMFVWAKLPNGLNSEKIARAALNHRMVLAPGTLFSPSGKCKEYFRFNVSRSKNPEIKTILKKILSIVP